MLTRRSTLVLLAAVAAAAPLARVAFAASMTDTPFTAAAFQAAQAAGKPILIAIHASWCPTCRAQKAVLGPLLTKPEFKDMVVLRVDFDAQKDVVAGFGANTQSTLIVFKGKAESGRSVGDTSGSRIEALLKSAV